MYIAECSDGSFYTGITSNPKRREFEHNHRIRSSLQLSKLPVKIVYLEKFSDRISAARRENEIKGWSRKKKIDLIESLH